MKNDLRETRMQFEGQMSVRDIIENDLIFVSIARTDVENKNISTLVKILDLFKKAKHKGQRKLYLTFEGYIEDKREIYEIKEIRQYILKVFKKYDCLFYFLTGDDFINQFMLQCLCKYSITNHIVTINMAGNIETICKVSRGISNFSKSISKEITNDDENLKEYINLEQTLKELGLR